MSLSKLDKKTKQLLGELAEFGILPKEIQKTSRRVKNNGRTI